MPGFTRPPGLFVGTALPALALTCALLAPANAGAREVANSDLFFKSAEAARQALEYYGAYDDPEQLERLQDLGYRLAQESSFTDYPFSFFLVDMPIPNAFALPGGHIFVTRGMLDLELSDEMLAGLLGHEIGHVVMQHGTKMKKRATLLNVLSQALLVGVIVSTSNESRDPSPAPPLPYGTRSEGGDRVMGAAAAGIVVSELLLRGYSREFEDEADDAGVRLAAQAGFSPQGFEELMSLMNQRLPQSKEYGYWNTHPFFDSRLRAATVRSELLARQEPRPADQYRAKTQAWLLELAEQSALEEASKPGAPAAATAGELVAFLENSAVTAWPRSLEARTIRFDRLEAARETELEKQPLARDYGELASRYREELGRVEALDPEAEHVAKLSRAIESFEKELAEIYPKAVEVFRGGVYQTDFLETFVSNYPEADEIAEVALSLGEAYGRLRRPEDAVSMLLSAWKKAPDSEPGRRAERGLLVLTPTLRDLAALQELAAQTENAELGQLAVERLEKTSQNFDSLKNGAEFLKKYPESRFSEAVSARLDLLAEDLYGEALLYQRIGDQEKALSRIQDILAHAPLSSAASRLRSSAVLES